LQNPRSHTALRTRYDNTKITGIRLRNPLALMNYESSGVERLLEFSRGPSGRCSTGNRIGGIDNEGDALVRFSNDGQDHSRARQMDELAPIQTPRPLVCGLTWLSQCLPGAGH
jgi:hypothetical protein